MSKDCFQIAERSLSYAKIVQVNAMKACFRIAERSLSYAKIVQNLPERLLIKDYQKEKKPIVR